MTFRRLAMALILTMVVALVGFACGEGALRQRPRRMRERQDSISVYARLGFVRGEGHINCGAGDGDVRADGYARVNGHAR